MKKRYIVVTVIIGLLISLALYLPGHYVVPILMYHNVEPCDAPCPANTVSPDAFDKQMAFLKNNNYHVIRLQDFIEGKLAGRSFPYKTVLITFDDGYDDNYDFAYPILQKYKFPATVFVPPADIGTPGYMTWDQVKHIDQHGFEVESHTMTQAYLPDITGQEKLVWEINESKKRLEEELGRSIRFLAYPIGGFNETIKSLVKEAGYQAAFATNRGYDRFNRDVFEINRIRPKNDDSVLELTVKLSGYYNLIRKSKSPY